jgi:hypothetical protein
LFNKYAYKSKVKAEVLGFLGTACTRHPRRTGLLLPGIAGRAASLVRPHGPVSSRSVTPPPSVNIVATFAERMNLADFQNAVPVLRELALANTLCVDLKDLDLVLTSEPAFVQRQT